MIAYLDTIFKVLLRSLAFLANFVELAVEVRKHGGHVCFEWPKGATGWMRSEVISMIAHLDVVT